MLKSKLHVSRKVLVVAPVGLAVAGIVYAAQPKIKPASIVAKAHTQTTKSITPIQPSADTQIASQTTSPVRSTAATTTDPTPEYGEDPNNPGIYTVFNKTAVMTEAGIPADQQTSADQLLSKMMNWRYKQITIPESDICYIVPVSKIAVSGADYRDNPITQLKYCNSIVVARFATWDAALAQYKGSGSF